jgi:hypothetical protein
MCHLPANIYDIRTPNTQNISLTYVKERPVPKRTHPACSALPPSGFEIGQNRMSELCYRNFYGTFGLSLSDNRHERAGMGCG